MFLYALILIWALIIFAFSSIQNPSNFGSSVIFSIVFHLVEYIILAFLVTIAFHRTNRFSNLFFLVGVPLIQKAGMPVLWLGLIGFFSGLFYTAPPFRFASRKGLGELLIGLNFGPLMVAGSALVQTGKLLPEAFLAGIPIGLLVAAIVYVNEFPDYRGDKATGKDTLIVVFGPEKARLGYVILVIGAFLSIAIMAMAGTFPMLSLIALLASFLVINIIKVLYKNYDSRLLQPANAGTINLHAITGTLFCIGIWLGSF